MRFFVGKQINRNGKRAKTRRTTDEKRTEVSLTKQEEKAETKATESRHSRKKTRASIKKKHGGIGIKQP